MVLRNSKRKEWKREYLDSESPFLTLSYKGEKRDIIEGWVDDVFACIEGELSIFIYRYENPIERNRIKGHVREGIIKNIRQMGPFLCL